MADVDAAAGPDGEVERRVADARRGALELARATLAAQHGLTAGHSDEVGLLCEEIADELGIDGWERANLLAAAQLHDIGKVAVPDEVLDKPGPLDPDEWELVRQHTPVGERIVMAVPELDEVARIVRHSHEHWDGSGYPDGLAGEEIPVASRVVLCVDAFHALRSDRPYRKGRSAAAAMEEIKAHSGTQFDPAVVAALGAAADRVRQNGAARFAGSRSLLRSRRVAALLVALVVGGSALAAIKPDLGDKGHSADASTDVTACSLDRCPLFEFPSLRQLAERAAPRRSAARPAAAVSKRSRPAARTRARHAPAGDGLRVAGEIESRPVTPPHQRAPRRGAAYAPIQPQQSPPPRAQQPARPVKQKKPKPAKPAHPQTPPAAPPPGLVGKPPPPRGNAYGHYKQDDD